MRGSSATVCCRPATRAAHTCWIGRFSTAYARVAPAPDYYFGSVQTAVANTVVDLPPQQVRAAQVAGLQRTVAEDPRLFSHEQGHAAGTHGPADPVAVNLPWTDTVSSAA